MITGIKTEVYSNEDFTEREKKLIDLYIMNASVFVNVLHTEKPMMMHPIETSNADFSLELLFQSSIEDEVGQKMAEDIQKRIQMYFDMAELMLVESKSVPTKV